MCPGTADHGSEDRQTVCPGTARSCVPAQPDRVPQDSQTRSRLRCGQKPVGTPLRSFSSGPEAGCPRCPRHGSAQSSARRESAPRASDKLRSPLPPGPRPGAGPGSLLAPCGLTGPSAGRAQGRQQRPEQRPAPAAHRPPAPPAPPPRHQDWHRSATGNKAGSRTAPGAGPAAAPGAGRAPLRSAALGGRQRRRSAPARPASRRGRNRAAPALPGQERSPGTAELPLSPVPRGHKALTPLRGGDSPLSWAAVPGLDSPFCEGIFQMSNLNFSCFVTCYLGAETDSHLATSSSAPSLAVSKLDGAWSNLG